MAKKGEKRHLKRLNAPKVRKVHRKEKKWAVTTSPGPHPAEDSLPLSAALRDNLNLARSRKEAEKILGRGMVEVDGKVRKNPNYPVGVMDVIRFPSTGGAWRVMHDRKGYLQFKEIDDEEGGFKLEKVVGKTPFQGGKFQLSFHDGKTLVGEFDDIQVSDTLKVSLPSLEIRDHIPCREGSIALITGGSNVGRSGKIQEIVEVEGPSPTRFLIEAGEEKFQSPEGYVFVIGEKKPEISLVVGD